MVRDDSRNQNKDRISTQENVSKSLDKENPIMDSFYVDVISEMNCAVIVFDSAGNIVEWNKEAARILGFKRVEAIGQLIWNCVPFFKNEKFTKEILTKIEKVDSFEGKDVVVTKMKEEISIYWIGRVLRDKDKRVTGFFVTIRDVSDEEEQSKRLEESERDFKLLFGEMNSAFALHKMIYNENGDPVDYRFIKVNKMFEKLTGLKAHAIVGRTVLEVMPNTEAYWIETYGKVAKTGEPIEYRNYSVELDRHYDVRAYSPQKDFFATTFIDVSIRYNYEQYLNKNKLFYENILETLNHGVWVINKENQIIYVNKSFVTLFNIKKAEIIGKDFASVSNRCFDKISQYFRKASKEKSPVNFVTECEVENGIIKFISGWILPGFEKGLYDGFICIVEDLSELKRTEKELEESRERLIFQYQYFPLPVYTYEFNGNDFVLIEGNKAGYEDTNVNVEKIIGMKTSELWHDEPQLIETINDCYHNKKTITIEREYVFRSTQKKCFVKATFGYVPPRYVLVTTEDITEKKKVEQAIKEAEKLFSYYVDNINAYVFIKDVDSNYIFINKEAEELFNIKREDLKIKRYNDFDFFDHKTAELNRKNDLLVIKSGEGYRFEDELKGEDAEKELSEVNKRYYTSLKFPLKDEDDKVIGVCGFSIDISRRKKMEKELLIKNKELEEVITEVKEVNEKLNKARLKAIESDRLKSAFLANMSHEIRTPMNSIVGFSGLLAEEVVSEDKRLLYSNLIASSSEHLLRIINDIIDIAKIESNQLTIEESWNDLSRIMSEIYSFHSQSTLLSGKKGVELKLNIEKILPDEVIFTDPVRFKQVFDNLITNAIKNTVTGTVEFGVYEFNKESQSMIFFVKDTGYGIPQKDQKTIFKRFTQLESPSLKSGTGLGLSIIAGILKLLKGSIWLESVEGEGTTFYFSVLSPTKISCELNMHDEMPSLIPKMSGRLVFIAEKDMTFYLYLSEVLGQLGANVKHAENSKALEELLEAEIPDLLFFDVDGSIFGGKSIISKIRKNKMDFPIIVQTSYPTSKEKKKFMKSGANEYLSKPIDLQKLYEIISKY